MWNNVTNAEVVKIFKGCDKCKNAGICRYTQDFTKAKDEVGKINIFNSPIKISVSCNKFEDEKQAIYR